MHAAQPRLVPHCVGAIVSAQGHYARHRPEESLLYRIVEQHVEGFFAHLGERDAPLPGFVREEFEAYLRCGRLERAASQRMDFNFVRSMELSVVIPPGAEMKSAGQTTHAPRTLDSSVAL